MRIISILAITIFSSLAFADTVIKIDSKTMKDLQFIEAPLTKDKIKQCGTSWGFNREGEICHQWTPGFIACYKEGEASILSVLVEHAEIGNILLKKYCDEAGETPEILDELIKIKSGVVQESERCLLRKTCTTESCEYVYGKRARPLSYTVLLNEESKKVIRYSKMAEWGNCK